MNRVRGRRERLLLLTGWCRAHGINRFFLLGAVLTWAGSAGVSGIGIPRVDPSPVEGPADLHSMALVAVAGAAGLTSLALEDRYPWITVSSPRRLPLLRGLWGITVIGVGLVLALASAPLLPSRLPAVEGYLAVASLWLGACVIGAVVGGRYAGMFAGLGLCSLAMSRLLPWEWNIVINPELTPVRTALAVCLPLVGLVAYARFGAASARRSL